MPRIIQYTTGNYKVDSHVINKYTDHLNIDNNETVGIYRNHKVIVPNALFSDWLDPAGTPYNSLADLISDINTFFFTSVGINALIPANQVVNTFAELPDATLHQDQVWYVRQQTGVFLLGTRKQSGFYSSNGTVWTLSNDPLQYISSQETIKNGFIDYNDSTGDVAIVADTWTDVPNNGLGAFTNKLYKPTDVNEVIDTSTGYLDFSELTLGSQLIIRNDFSITPSTNNSLLELRYLLGQGEGEYPLLFWSERLDNGSGISYQRVPVFSIYMGDTNTQGGVGKLQIKLSSNGTFNNAGSYINIQLR